jgi:ubiquinone/menaquinone biosynthesis C-methylase UbiE
MEDLSHAKGYVDPAYLHAAAERVAQLKQITYQRMDINSGHHVLDVGCGPATDTIPLAALVGSTGKSVGVDYDGQMVEAANHRAEMEGVRGWVEHRQSDAYSLPFKAAAFDSCRSERLFQHLEDPARALAEMVRVTKPGGVLVVLDTDWATISIDTPESDVEKRVMRTLAEKLVSNGYAGRQLYRLFKQQGLQNIQVDVFPSVATNYSVARMLGRLDDAANEALAAGIVSAEELQRFQHGLEEADRNGLFFACVNLVMVAGTKA